jgi:hypothetical protein
VTSLGPTGYAFAVRCEHLGAGVWAGAVAARRPHLASSLGSWYASCGRLSTGVVEGDR